MMAKSVIVLVLLATIGCASVEPYDYTRLQASKPRSILVIPPLNNTVEIGAPYTFISTISKPLAEKGYYVFPVAVIDTFLKENGLPTPGEMNQVPLERLREHTGADAVLYVSIKDWGQNYQVVSSKLIVSSDARLVDARTGELLWETSFHMEQSSGDGGAGIAGALVGALVTQIIGSLGDRTPALSSMANFNAVDHSKRGLLAGPYKKTVQ